MTMRVGDVLRGPKGERALVGDLNEEGGVCDDCTHDSQRYGGGLERGWSVESNVYDSLAARRWIPVTERLPEVGESVLVASSSGGFHEPLVLAWGGEFFEGLGLSPDGRAIFYRPTCTPTHWQPLPDPPQP